MWSDREANPPRCDGSGTPAAEAYSLPDGFPHGAGLCSVCWGFVARTPDGALEEHDAFRGARTSAEAEQRTAWFNAFGWTA